MSRPIVLDNKRRASFGPEFRPGDTFIRSVSGSRVTFEKIERDDVPVAKPVRRGKGKWLMLPRGLKISRATIADAIRADRTGRYSPRSPTK
jgi:hypothetical protein